MCPPTDGDVSRAVAAVTDITSGRVDAWIDSIALVALRRRDRLRRMAKRLRQENEMNQQQVDLNEAYVTARAELVSSLNRYGTTTPLSEIPIGDLGDLDWSLTTMSGLLSAELARRDATTDFASKEQS